jgi:hypothetical protein
MFSSSSVSESASSHVRTEVKSRVRARMILCARALAKSKQFLGKKFDFSGSGA